MKKSVVILALLLCTPAWADGIFVPPTANGTALVGQLPGTATNDNASAGNVGEYVSCVTPANDVAAATITVTIATPAVVTWPSNPYIGSFTTGTNWAAPVVFTTTGALPTGLVAGTVYYVVGSTVSGNNFSLATTVANAFAGTYIATTGSQSGVQTGTPGVPFTSGVAINFCALNLTAGDWDVTSNGLFSTTSTTSLNQVLSSISLVSNTLDRTADRFSENNIPATVIGTTYQNSSVNPVRFSIASTTTLFGVSRGQFSVSTLVGWGALRARRTR